MQRQVGLHAQNHNQRLFFLINRIYKDWWRHFCDYILATHLYPWQSTHQPPRCCGYWYWYMHTAVADQPTPHIAHTLTLEYLSGSRTYFDVISRRMTYLGVNHHLSNLSQSALMISWYWILHPSPLCIIEVHPHQLAYACPVFTSHDKTIKHFQWQHLDWWREILLIHTAAGTR